MRPLIKRLAGGLAASLLFLAPATAAYAADPVTISAGQSVVDQTGKVDVAKLKAASDKLYKDHKINLYVVVVDNFTNPTDPQKWSTAVANAKGFGSKDVLYAVATSSGQTYVTRGPGSAITNAQRDAARSKALDALKADRNDITGAALALTNELDSQLSGPGPAPFLVGGAVVVLGGGAAVWLVRRRKKAAEASGITNASNEQDRFARMSIEQLRAEAGPLLVQADDAVKSSEQELGFAEAQFGTNAIADFTGALNTAKAHMSESFKQQQQLDDHIPDTPQQQRAWLIDIIQRSEAAIVVLKEQEEAFNSLRELEKNAPQILAKVQADLAEAHAKVSASEGELAGLRQTYSDTAIAQVQDNIAQAKDRLTFVDNSAQAAAQQLAAGDNGAAAVSVRAAEGGMAQALDLVAAVTNVSGNLATARQALEKAVSLAAQDLAQAKGYQQSGQFGQLSAPIGAVEGALSQVKAQYDSGRIDPVSLLQGVEKATHDLDEALAGARDQAEQARRAEASLQQSIIAAQSQISATNDYIAARRGGVGTEARTRLAEAQRNLDYAISISKSDPVQALNYAHQANALAGQAAQLAQSDVDQFGSRQGGMFGGNGGGSGLGGAILGGILINSILNSGNHNHGGWGGDSGGWGGFGGGDSGGGFGGDGGGWGGDSGGGDSF